MEFIADVTQPLNVDNRSTILENLHGLLNVITLHIKDLRQHIDLEKRNYAKWEKICQNNPDFANKYSLSVAQSKENELLCKSLVCRALAVNRDICLCCSILNGSAQNASSNYHVLLENQSNFWSLLSPDYLWFHLCEQAVVTGSSCFDATGLNTLAAQKNHYRKFILKEQKEITEETAANLKHGIETEVHAIATVVGLLLPALLSPCCTFIEVGQCFLILKKGNTCWKYLPMESLNVAMMKIIVLTTVLLFAMV